MTEREYASLENFKGLPIYEDSPAAEAIDNPSKVLGSDVSEFDGTSREADTLERAISLSGDPSLTPKGGVRFKNDDGTTFVYAYFWKRRG